MSFALTQASGGMQYQLQIYMRGMQNIKPQLPVSFEELEQKAQGVMKPEAFAYIAGGAGGETTIQNNKEAFNKWKIVPRMLNDVSQRSIEVQLFDAKFSTPVLLAPIGVLGIAHPDAEIAVARAAMSLQVPQIVSTVSSKSLEEIGNV